ncbi:MAG: Rab family GTPase [Candidatus Hodarchaeales archaeon]|jgi:Ras-related protein Rab-1A
MAILAKIILIGDGAVGKTALRENFMGKQFESKYLETIGADLSMKSFFVSIDEERQVEIKAQIWDLAGQPRYRRVRSTYYKGANGVILVFDIIRRITLENTLNWLEEMKKYLINVPFPPVILLGNKVDLREITPDTISYEEGQNFAVKLANYYCNDEFPIPLFETSAKTGINVQNGFHELGKLIFQLHKKRKEN